MSKIVILAWMLFVVSVVGFLATFPLWLLNIINDRTMLGITLVLSWAALWYESFNGILHAKERQKK